MSEIEPPSAEIVSMAFPKNLRHKPEDIKQIYLELISLSHRLEASKHLTLWPEWTQCQANSMRDFARDLVDSKS